MEHDSKTGSSHPLGATLLEQERSRYSNYSGTGNTLNANHPIVRRLILDSLRYWVGEMHVDGFRFDLADRHATLAGCADGPDGGRSPPHAGGQQQRLLPGQ